PTEEDEKSTKYSRLREIGKVLRGQSLKQSMWIRVTSDEFYAPWNLIYSHKLENPFTGEDARIDGFWGFQHLIEHVPKSGGQGNEFVFARPLQVGLQLDQTIDQSLNVRCNAVVQSELDCYAGSDLKLVP